MSKQWQLRRGTTSENNGFTGAQGELTMDTDTNALRIHDGVTQGGHMIDSIVEWQVPTAENNYTWYRKYSSGWVEQGGVFNASSDTGGTNTIINLPVTMANSHYTLTLCLGDSNTSNTSVYMWCCEKTISSFTTVSSLVNHNATETGWQVCGMAA